MDCNRDEAARAKEIAEKKFLVKDFLGAKKFALKAQSLYPTLDGVQHMLTVLDVYISSSENKVNGETDWYKILNVNPRADEETIRKQYRKLALVLHPDKNKSIGADGAFKLISEAWSLLSDRSKRSIFDQKRNININVPKQKPTPPPHGSNGVNKSTTTSKTGAQKGKAPRKKRTGTTPNGTDTTPNGGTSTGTSHNRTSSNGMTSSAYQQKYPSTPTFWTVCHRCRIQHEYLRMYLHRNLLCPGCNLPYFAFEYPPPTPTPTPNVFNHFHQNPKVDHHQGPSRVESAIGSNGWGSFNPFSQMKNAPFANQGSTSMQSEKPKVDTNDLQTQARSSDADFKMNKCGSKSEAGFSSDSNAVKKRKAMENPVETEAQGAKTGISEPDKGTKSNNKRSRSSRDYPSFDFSKVLAESAKAEIQKKLNEWGSEDVSHSNSSKSKMMVNETEKKKVFAKENNKSNDLKNSEPILMTVPDSDFHDFDKDRTEICFGENQVWAAYDGDDGMPRHYVIIREVISSDPFKVRIGWLNSELGPLNWVGTGFLKTCGDFRIGKEEISTSLNSFSHKVKYVKGSEGNISVYPKKGDVWALYRNWSPDWNELTQDEVIHKYDMVEVIEDYDVELGVLITPLIKVAGFKTIFHRHLNAAEIRRIPKEEIFRFSHQVPSFLFSGQEGINAPKGCRELDPAATPLELLQVINKR